MRLGLIGRHISYSLSPLIHEANFNANNINATYSLIDLPFDEIIPLLKLYDGLNVTIPYKTRILDYVDVKSEAVKAIGAANTIHHKEGQLFAYNTDVYGFYQLLSIHGLTQLPKETKVLVIGAGGAAKAVLYTLSKYTPYQLWITNRTKEKANQLIENKQKVVPFSSRIDLTPFNLVINTTSVGVQAYQSPIIIKSIKENSVFIDLNYQSSLKFLDDAKKLGATTINGLSMLLYQAAKSVELWTNQKAHLSSMKDAIIKKV